MNTNLIIIIALTLIIALYIIFVFNSLIMLRNDVRKSFSGIDIQLKRRCDLIPNLVNTVKAYASHEKELLENITLARASILSGSANSNVSQMAKGENLLGGALKSLFAVAENYPNLKANENFLKLQEELSETEDQIAASRRIYNENVTYYNNKIQMVPSNIVASVFKFEESEFFEASDLDRQVAEVKV